MECPPETFILLTLQGLGLILFFGFLAHTAPYVIDKHGLRAYPGPLLARLSELWLGWHGARGTICRAVRAVHQTYGPVVRIAPNHISIADPSALHHIYGHGAATLKSDLYDVFAPIGRTSVFTTRSREEHTRKRKALAHTFSQKSVLDFEPTVKDYLGNLIKHWNSMCSAASKGKGGVIGDAAWQSQDGRAVFDSLRWYNFMVFDIIGDLVFRAPFGMSKRGSDLALIAKHQEKAMESYDSYEAKLDYDTVPAVQAVNERATFLITMGVLPAHWRRFIRKLPLPWLQVKSSSTEKISRLAITAVANRSQHAVARNDILGKYLEARDDKGQKMDNLELSSEALTLLIGGTDTTSNTAAAITFYLAQNPHVQTKLQDELDSALGVPAYEDEHNNQPVLFSYERIKHLPYLQDVVNEGLRLFSTIGIGLPRVVPEEGLTVFGHTFAPGTVVSVPTYVTNRDKTIWGEDAESFNPDRWEKGDKITMSRAFAPFSTGSRACLGRNLALMELLLVVANVFHRFEARLAYPGQTMTIHDAFLRKPQTSTVAIKHRGSA